MTENRATSGGRTRMWSEARRSWVSALVGSGLTVVIVTAWVLIHPGDSAVAGPLGTVLTWAILVSVHAFLTLRAFGGLSGDDLETAVDASGLVRQANRIRPSWSVQVSSMALVVVALLVVVPAWRDHAMLLVMALVMVIASWADMALSFALHYAAIDDGGFTFPGKEPRSFADYIYLAIAVQATFAVPDVTVTTTALRRQLTVHTVLSFVFNTVILAVIVTLMLGS